MRKRLLLIALFVFVLNISSVDAMGKYTSFKATLNHGSEIHIPINAATNTLINHLGNASPYSTYVSYNNTITLKDDTTHKQYPAFCIDPGKGVSPDLTCEMLDSKSYPMLYAAANDTSLTCEGCDYSTADLVFRILGMMERQSVVVSGGGNLGAFSDKKNNVALVISWHKAALDAGVISEPINEINENYLPQGGTFGTAMSKLSGYAHYWIGAPGHSNPPEVESSSIKNSSYPGGTYFRLSGNLGDAENPIYEVTAVKPGTTDVQITAQAPTTVNILQKWNGTSAKFSINVSGTNCKNNGVVTITGVIPGEESDSKMPYMCTARGNSQSFVALLPGGNGEKISHIPIDCQICKEQKDTKREVPGDIGQRVEKDATEQLSIEQCCASSDPAAYVEEYKIDDLFLSIKNSYEGAASVTNKCNNDVYRDKELEDQLNQNLAAAGGLQKENVFNYCKLYSTENLSVKNLPGPITSANGKYFKLEDKYPEVYGERNATIKIDYRSIRARYEQAILGSDTDPKNSASSPGGVGCQGNKCFGSGGELGNYNKYQQDRSKYELMKPFVDEGEYTYTQPLPDVHFERYVCKGTTSVGVNGYYYSSSSSSKKCSEANSGQVKCTNPSGCTGYTDELETKDEPTPTCIIKYHTYLTRATMANSRCGSGNSAQCTIDYWKIYAKDEFIYSKAFSSKNYKGLEIFTDPTVHRESYPLHTMWNFNHSQYTTCETGINNTYKIWPQSDGWSHSIVNYKKWDPIHNGYSEKNTPQEVNNQLGKANNDKAAFEDAKILADDMEKIAYHCEKFFDEYTDNPYHLNPTANFHYMQVYLNGQKEKVGPEFTIGFDPPACNEGKGYTGNIDSADIFQGGTESMIDVKLKTDSLRSGGEQPEKHTPLEKLWDKYIRRSYKYTADCKWDKPPSSTQMTLYPGPQVTGYSFDESVDEDSRELVASNDTPASDKFYTGHKYQYALYLTTYQGTYQTWWDMRGLGTDRTLQKFTTKFNEAGQTCAEKGNVPDGALSRGTAEELKQGPVVPFTCKLNVKLGGLRIGKCDNGVTQNLPCTDPYDVNELYEFKVVDPKNIFPNPTKWKSEGLAKNWRTGSTGDGDFGRTYTAIMNVASTDSTYSPEHMTYSFKLNTEALNLIKRDNKNANAYNQFDKLNMSCDCVTGPENEACGTIFPSGSCLTTVGGKASWKYKCSKCKSKYITDTLAAYYWNNKNRNLNSVRNDVNNMVWVQ